MRQILVDHARGHYAAKRGGDSLKLTLNEGMGSKGKDFDLIALEDALNDLAELSPQQSRIVELRFFSGLTIELFPLGGNPAKGETGRPGAWLFPKGPCNS